MSNTDSKILTYADLKSTTFKYFISHDDVCVYDSDISYLPNEVLSNGSTKKVEFKLDRLTLVLKHVLRNYEIAVEEYIEEYFLEEEKENKLKNSSLISINNSFFKLSKSGHSLNHNDFSDIFDDVIVVCGISTISNNPNYNMCFSYVSLNKIYYTHYMDDDLLSVTYSLINMYGIQTILVNKNMKGGPLRILSNYNTNIIKVTDNGNIDIINAYFLTNYPMVYFNTDTFCIVNIHDYDIDLLDIVSNCETRQGKRILNNWLSAPLLDKEQINNRLDIVEYFTGVKISLKSFMDIRRIILRIENKSIGVGDMVSMGQGIRVIGMLIEKIKSNKSEKNTKECDRYSLISSELIEPLNNISSILSPVANLIFSKLSPSGEILIGSNVYYSELLSSRSHIEREIESELSNTKILFSSARINNGNTFKISKKEYNTHVKSNTFKYNILSLSKTGVNFTTKALSDLTNQLNIIHIKIHYETQVVLESIRETLFKHISTIEIYNYIIGLIDVYKTLSYKVNTPGYSRAVMYDKNDKEFIEYKIKNMWHPGVELSRNNSRNISTNIVKNSIEFDKKQIVLSGPNMGGKSTILRTISVVSLLAQIGCYVPAEYASLPIFERILFRINAQDHQFKNMSTFMVEMTDLTNIVKSDTFNLILIDELGRGTSAVDGVSIIRAVQEFLINRNNYTMITTHYDYIKDNKNSKISENIKQLRMGTDSINNNFTYKLEEGKSESSYALKVAEMAGFPVEVIAEAKEYIARNN